MKHLTLLFLLLSLSCSKDKTKTFTTKDYHLTLTEVGSFIARSTNTTTSNPLTINAELIKLKPLINTINNNDSIFYKIDNSISKKTLKVNLEVINDTKTIRTNIIAKIIASLNLKQTKTESTLLELVVADSSKVYKHFAKKSSTNESKIYTSKDSIALKNVSLKKFAEIVNKQFNVETFSTNNTIFIDYNFNTTDFETAKKHILKTLGLKFTTSNHKKTTYLISKNK